MGIDPRCMLVTQQRPAVRELCHRDIQAQGITLGAVHAVLPGQTAQTMMEQQ